jgi:alkylation response protein AidB-like acyl-CoA dehydrogenase
VNGLKKWITGAHMADFFTTAVVVEGKGISLLLIPRELPGISIRKMETMFDTVRCVFSLDDYRV